MLSKHRQRSPRVHLEMTISEIYHEIYLTFLYTLYFLHHTIVIVSLPWIFRTGSPYVRTRGRSTVGRVRKTHAPSATLSWTLGFCDEMRILGLREEANGGLVNEVGDTECAAGGTRCSRIALRCVAMVLGRTWAWCSLRKGRQVSTLSHQHQYSGPQSKERIVPLKRHTLADLISFLNRRAIIQHDSLNTNPNSQVKQFIIRRFTLCTIRGEAYKADMAKTGSFFFVNFTIS